MSDPAFSLPSEIAVSVEAVSKAYRLWENPASRLTAPALEQLAVITTAAIRERLLARAARSYHDYWALRDINIAIKRGQSLAIVGRNGSGKSTLLQIIAKTLQPSAGRVAVNGRVAALLELGSGFNPEFTGRENIHLNAALLGLTPTELSSRYDAIVAFADIGEFIEHPVKTYSSGMVVRLAFAVAAHIDADILIVDEALAVGDARFQLKCARAIDQFIARGVTLLFVSHDLSMVKRLCDRAVLLERGEILYDGRPNDVVNLYSKLLVEGATAADLSADIRALASSGAETPPNAVERSLPLPSKNATATSPGASDEVSRLRLELKAVTAVIDSHPRANDLQSRIAELLRSERLHVQITGNEFSYGGEKGVIHEVSTIDADGQPRTWFTAREAMVVRMRVEAREYFPEPIFALTIKNVAGVEIYGTNTLYGNQPTPPIEPGTQREIDFCFNVNLIPGHYFISVGFTHFVGQELLVLHRRYDVLKIEVHGRDRAFGIADLQAQIFSRDIVPVPK